MIQVKKVYLKRDYNPIESCKNDYMEGRLNNGFKKEIIISKSTL